MRINTKLRSVCFLSFAEAMMMRWRYSSDISNKKRVFKVTYQTRVGVFLWAMIDCASIIFVQNFWGLFSEKNISSIICTFDEFCRTKLPFIYHATIFLVRDQCYRQIEAAYCNIHGTLMPKKVTLD